MKKCIICSTGILVGLLIFLGGCGRGESGKKVLVMVPKGVHPYYEPCKEGFEDAAAKYGVEAQFTEPQAFEPQLQVKKIENLIPLGVDGIAVSAVSDTALKNVIDEAMDAGIKIICFDAPAPSTRSLCYIGTINESAGYTGGKEFAKHVKAGKVAVLQGGLDAPNLNARYEGFKRAIAEHPEIELVGREDTEGKFELSVNKAETLIQKYGDELKGIFGVSASGAPGAAKAVEGQGKTGTIVVAGFDDMPQTKEAIRKGSVQFCLAQKTYKMGWLSVEKLLEAIEGKELVKEIDTGLVVVDKDNVDTYMEEMKEEFK
jgi:ribose transport system substrate-binding protein